MTARELPELPRPVAWRVCWKRPGESAVCNLFDWEPESKPGVDHCIEVTPLYAAQRVSEGMVMVPRVPTDAMIHAGANAPGMKALGDSSATMQARGYPLPAEAFVSGKGPLEQAWEAMIEAALAQRGRE